MAFELLAQGSGLKQHRQQVGTVLLAEIEQGRQGREKHLPGEPLVVGKAANFLAAAAHHQGVRGEDQAQQAGLNQQEATEEGQGHGDPAGRIPEGDEQQAEVPEQDHGQGHPEAGR